MNKIQITKEEYGIVKKLMKENKNKNVDKRLRAIALRYEGKSNSEIANITGFSNTWVTLLTKKFKKEGPYEFVKSKYKANNRSLSEEKEKQILKEFQKQAEKGQIVTVKDIKQAFDKKIGKDTGRGYIYMVLDRHNWRKVMPRSKHPKKASQEAIEASKKLTKR